MVDPFTPIHTTLDIPKHPTWGLGSSLPRHGNIQGGEGKERGGYKYINIIGWELIASGRKQDKSNGLWGLEWWHHAVCIYVTWGACWEMGVFQGDIYHTWFQGGIYHICN